MNKRTPPSATSRLKSRKKTMTLGSLIEITNRHVRPHTAQVSRALLLHVIAAMGSDPLLSTINEQYIRCLSDYMLSNLTASSVRTYLQRLHSLLTTGVELRQITLNPMPPISSLIPRHRHSLSRQALTSDQVARLSASPIRHESTRRAFLFSVHTGLRLSDIETLQWGDLHVVQAGILLRKIQVKTAHPVEVLLTRQACQLIGIVGSIPKHAPSDIVFYDLMSRSTISSDLREWALSSGLNVPLTFHVARHTFASLLHGLGTSIADVSSLCGHSSVRTTERYIHGYQYQQFQAIHQMEDLFDEIEPNPPSNIHSTKTAEPIILLLGRVFRNLMKTSILELVLQKYEELSNAGFFFFKKNFSIT